MSDLDHLVPGIVAGDPHAFGQWVAGVETSLRVSLRRYAAVVDVEAVLQEALLRAWQAAPRFRPDGKPNGFLRFAQRIAKNLAVDLARRERRGADIEEGLRVEVETPAPAAPDPFLREAVEECQEKLPRKTKKALAARLESAGAEADAALAARVKMRLNTFLQNVTRARRALEKCLEKRGIRLAEELA